MNEQNQVHCQRCGSIEQIDDIEYAGITTQCPNCEDQVLLSEEEVRRILDSVDAEASEHGRNYGAGMRLGRQMIEKELIDKFQD